MGYRTAWVLLASYAYACALEWLAVPFWAPLWILADLFVLKATLSPNMTLQDELVAALFPIAWVGNALDAGTNYAIGMQVVILQFLIVLPWAKLQRVIFSISHGSLRAGGIQEVCNGGKH